MRLASLCRSRQVTTSACRTPLFGQLLLMPHATVREAVALCLSLCAGQCGWREKLGCLQGLVDQILQFGRIVRPVLGITIAPPQVPPPPPGAPTLTAMPHSSQPVARRFATQPVRVDLRNRAM